MVKEITIQQFLYELLCKGAEIKHRLKPNIAFSVKLNAHFPESKIAHYNIEEVCENGINDPSTWYITEVESVYDSKPKRVGRILTITEFATQYMGYGL